MLLLQNTISARNRHRYHHRHHHQMQYHYHHHHFSIITISSFPCRSVVSLWSSPSTSSVPNNLLGMCKDCLVQSFPFQLATPKNIQFSRSVDWVIHQKPLLHPFVWVGVAPIISRIWRVCFGHARYSQTHAWTLLWRRYHCKPVLMLLR